MHSETCFALAEVLAERNDGFIQITNGSPEGEDGHGFIERLAEISGRPVIMNAVQAFDRMPEVHRGQLEWLASCRERGLPVYGQGVTTDAGFTLTFEDWNLFDESDAWCEATTGNARGAPREARRPRPPSGAARRARLHRARPDRGDRRARSAHGRDEAVGEHDRRRRRCGHRQAPGRRHARHRRRRPARDDVLLQARDQHAPRRVPRADDRRLPPAGHLRRRRAHEVPHRRPVTRPRRSIRAVREHGILTLEQAHWKLSALPAHCAGFTDRGTLEVGKAADVVVYDFDRLDITPVEKVHDFPGGEWRRVQRGVGYRWVLVNGEVTIDDDKETGTPAGRLLRHETAG